MNRGRGNLQRPVGVSNDALFYSPAFIIGFSDGYKDLPFQYPDRPGPRANIRSSQMAYERGRQFGVLWRGRPITNLTKMKKALLDFKKQGYLL